MNKEEAIAKINENDTDDFQVFTKTEHDTFLTNYKETEVSKGISEHVSGVHQKYDDTIKGVLGKEKPHDVKTHEFLKTELTTLTQDIQGKEAKISELEIAVNDKSGSEALKLANSELNAYKQKHQKALDEFKTERESKESEIHNVRMANYVDHSLMGIKFLSSIPEDARSAMIEIAKNDVVKNASFLDGKAVFLDSNGDPERDEQLNIVTIEMKMQGKLKSIIDQGRKQEGVKIDDPKVVKKEDGKIDVVLSIPDSIKTNAELLDFLLENGLKRHTDEFSAAYKKYSKDLIKV